MVEILVRKKAVPNIQFLSWTPFSFYLAFLSLTGCYFSVSCAVTSDLPYISVWISFRAEASDMFSVHTHYPVISFNLLVLNILWTLTSPRFMSLPGFSSDLQIHILNCLFKKYLKCSIYNTELLSLPPDMLNQVRPRSVMASPSFRLHSSNFGIIPDAFLSLILYLMHPQLLFTLPPKDIQIMDLFYNFQCSLSGPSHTHLESRSL